MTAMVWDLFGIPANSDVPDSDGCIWTVASSDGWDAPDQRTGFVSPTSLHGQLATNQYADGRPVVMEGLILAPNEAAAWAAYDRVGSSMPGLLGEGDITAYEPVPKFLTVVQDAPPRVSKPASLDPSGRISMRYRLTLRAEYPWKRAVTAEDPVAINAGATVPFTGGGNWPAEIVVTTTSSGTVNLTASGLSLTASTVPSGTVFDSMPGAFSVTGPSSEDLFSAMLPGFQWPAVVPGSNSFVNSGTANLVLSYYPTYA